MKITTILFDLDGTLLPMDQDQFVKHYFSLLAAKLVPYGYEPKGLIHAVWAGTAAMIKNGGKCTNEEAFWNTFTGIYGEQAMEQKPVLDEFYRKEFHGAKTSCGYNPEAAKTVATLKKMGFQVALATNPIFPAVATESRMKWAGLSPEDFALYTTYENSNYCKPSVEYYQAILKQLGVNPKECLMVGNDVIEDMIAASAAGMQVFLLTDCLINKVGKDLSMYPQGSFKELLAFVKEQV